ncbi:hypothetical protein [Lutimaribacter saemankumensis]|nr:hypothetical protein [Lutimaribacter saemankumensis]
MLNSIDLNISQSQAFSAPASQKSPKQLEILKNVGGVITAIQVWAQSART